MKILVASSDPAVVETVLQNSETDDLLIVAADSIGALEAISQQSPDLLLLEADLPGSSGIEMCRHIREQSSIPIIMLASPFDENSRIECLDAGADDCVMKPLKTRTLKARIRAVMRRCTSSSGVTPMANEIVAVNTRAQSPFTGDIAIESAAFPFPLFPLARPSMKTVVDMYGRRAWRLATNASSYSSSNALGAHDDSSLFRLATVMRNKNGPSPTHEI